MRRGELVRRSERYDFPPSLVRFRGREGTDHSQRRAKLILQRQSNPAVLVDIPKEPGPEELEEAAAETTEEGAKEKEKKA